MIDNDIGLVRLPSPLPHTPIPLNADPLTTDNVGEVLRWVGWGASGDDDGTLCAGSTSGDTRVDR